MLQFCLQRTRAKFLTMSGYSSVKIMLLCVRVTTSETLVLSSCMDKRKDALIKHINEISFFFLILKILFYSGSGISCKLIESFLQHVYIHIIPATHSEILSFLSDCASYQHLLPILTAAKLCTPSFIRCQSVVTACTVEQAPCCCFTNISSCLKMWINSLVLIS